MRRRIFVIWFTTFLLVPGNTFGQKNETAVDSLNEVISNNESPLSVAEAYVGLTELLYITYPDTVIPLCEKAIDIIEERFDQADTAEQKQLLVVKGAAYNNIGFMYDNEGRMTEALEIYFKAIKIQEKLNDKKGLASSYNNIGFIFKAQKDFEQSLQYHMKSLDIKIELRDTMGMANTNLNLGAIADELGKADESKAFYLKSLRLWRKTGVKRGIGAAMNNVGYILKKEGNADSAIVMFNQALEVFEELNHREGIGSVYNNMANIYYSAGNYKKALEYGLKAMEIAKEIGFLESIRDASHTLGQIYYKTGNYKKCVEMERLTNDLRDSIFNRETKKASIQKELAYEYEKKEAIREVEYQKERELAVMERKKQEALNAAEKRIQTIVITIVSGGLFVVLVLSIIIYKRLLVTRRQRNLIQSQQTEILEKNEELNMQNEEILAISDKIEEQNKQLSRQNQDILASIQYAKKIQQTILPDSDEFHSIVPNAFVLYLPKDIVSGDFYWMYHQPADKNNPNNLVFFAAVDCTGHGVPGAFMSIIGSNGLNQIIREEGVTNPKIILEKLTDFVIERISTGSEDKSLKDGMDLALCCLNLDTNELQFAGAYNPLYLFRNNELSIVKATKRPIGLHLRKNIPDFESYTLQLQKGDRLYIFSDGYADQFGGSKSQKYTYGRLRTLLSEIHTLPPEKQRQKLLEEHIRWRGNEPQLDDICLIGFGV